MTLHWINPLALAGLAAAGLPVVIHLLRRQRATRVPFPTLRFLTDSRAAAVRLRSLADPLVLLVRVATLVAAVLAAAQPQVLTSWRRASYDARTSRAVVVDRSASGSSSAGQRDEALALERRGSFSLVEIPASRAGAALCTAVTTLLDGPVARHEIVVISDFRHGEITEADLACVPADVGLRFVQVGGNAPTTASEALAGLGLDGRRILQRAEFDGPRTRVTMTSDAASEPGRPIVLAPPGEADAVSRLFRAVARAGAPAMSPQRPLTFVFAGQPAPAVTAMREPWMIAALVGARQSTTMRIAADAHRGGQRLSLSDAWTTVARMPAGEPLVSAAAAGERLTVAVAAAPADLLSVVAVRTMLTASVAPPDWTALEPERIPPSHLKAWARPAAPIPPERFKPSAPGDARWLWALTLALLGVEWVVRRERTPALRTEARAA